MTDARAFPSGMTDAQWRGRRARMRAREKAVTRGLDAIGAAMTPGSGRD